MPSFDSYDISNPTLLPAHEQYLGDRAVSRDFALHNRIRSVGGGETRDFLGFAYDADCLAIPYLDQAGSVIGLRLRVFDDPEGRRFLTPAGAEVLPYIPPCLAPTVLANPQEPLALVEGPIKALALCEAGIPAIGLGGVSAGGHEPEALRRGEFRPHQLLAARVALRTRPITIVFDAGRARNPRVAQGEALLARALMEAGAIVRVAALPLHDGQDQGPDDYVHRHGREALLEIIGAAVPASPFERARAIGDGDPNRLVDLLQDPPFLAACNVARSFELDLAKDLISKATRIGRKAISNEVERFRRLLNPDSDGEASLATPYRVVGGRICALRRRPDGTEELEELTTFDAKIIEDRVIVGAAAAERRFVIDLITEARTQRLIIPSAEYEAMRWPVTYGGASAVIVARRDARDRVREAIQMLSSPTQVDVYANTGWVQVNGVWTYLHAGGAVGSPLPIVVELEPPLDRHRLAEPGGDVREAVRASLGLLALGDFDTGVALYAATYLAPVASIAEPRFAVWLVGQSGTRKSSLAAATLAHFGRYSYDSLPLNWSCTANYLEEQLHRAKDALTVIDDYAPRPGVLDQSKADAAVEKIVRAIGDGHGRGRMNADTSLKASKPPRGVVVITGEDLPPGLSVMGRLLVVRPDPTRLDLALLSAYQANTAKLPTAMRGYVEWLQPQMPALLESVPNWIREYRSRAQAAATTHTRVPETVAQLAVGLALGLRFAVHTGAITDAQLDQYFQAGFNSFMAAAAQQNENVTEEDAGHVFVENLSTLLKQGLVRLDDPDAETDAESRGVMIGYLDASYVDLLPTAALREVNNVLRSSNVAPLRRRPVVMGLKKLGLVEGGGDHTTVQVRVGSCRPRVWRLPATVLEVTATPPRTRPQQNFFRGPPLGLPPAAPTGSASAAVPEPGNSPANTGGIPSSSPSVSSFSTTITNTPTSTAEDA